MTIIKTGTGFFSRISARVLYTALGFLYAMSLYTLYPTFHKWVAFHAFRLESHGPEHVFISMTLAIVAVFVSSLVRHPIYRLFNSAFVFSVYIPALTLLPYFDPDIAAGPEPYVLLTSSLIVSIVGMFVSKRTKIRVPLTLSAQGFYLLLGATSLVITALIFLVFRDIFSISSLTDVYYQRLRYRESANVFSYFIHWQMMVFSPLCLFFGTGQKVWLTVIGMIGVFVVYGITAFKMAPAIAIIIFLAMRWQRLTVLPTRLVFIPSVFLFVLLFVYLVDTAFLETPVLTYYIIDRNILGPGIMQLMTLETFKDMPNALWSGSFLSAFIDEVYDKDPFIILGQTFFNREVRANTGYFADGFINWGFNGVILMSILAAICLAITSILMNKLPKKFIVITFPFALGYINGPLQVTLLTNGLIIFWMLLLLYPAHKIVRRATT